MQWPDLRKDNYSVYICSFLLLAAFLLYANTIGHHYALDDVYAITMNQYVRNGLAGIPDILTTGYFDGFTGHTGMHLPGGRYRPLLLISFAIETELFGLNPGISHLINVFLYAILVVMVFIVVLRLSGEPNLAFFTALFFLFHPVHTEVVANIKGRDELLALLFGLIALYSSLKSHRIFPSIMFFLALCSKEIALNFIILIPAVLWLFGFHNNLRKLLFHILPLFIALFLYLMLRIHAVTFSSTDETSILNNPFLYSGVSEKYATILVIFLKYLKLLLIPFPLTFDYSPFHLTITGWNNSLVWISLLVHFLMIAGIFLAYQNKIYLFSIVLYFLFLLPVSNIFFNIGSFMNERFLFIPSLGYSLLSAWLLDGLKRHRIVAGSIMAGVLSIYCFLTVNRNRAWYDNYTLFSTDIRVSSNSILCNSHLANEYVFLGNRESNPAQKAWYYRQAEKYFSRSLQLFPEHLQALRSLADIRYRINHDTAGAIQLQMKVFELTADEYEGLRCLRMIESLSSADCKKHELLLFLKRYPGFYPAHYSTAVFYGKDLKDSDSSILFFTRALMLRPAAEAYTGRAMVYYMQHRYDSALNDFLSAAQMDVNSAQAAYNVGMVYHKLGMKDSANRWYSRFLQRKRNAR